MPPSRNSHRPASTLRIRPSRKRRANAFADRGIGNVLAKSEPVPTGRNARRASWVRRSPSCARKPFTASFSVPSPPTATTVLAPAASASRARSVACPRRSVRCTSNAPPSSLRRSVSCVRQRRPVFPFEEAWFTMKTVSAAMVLPERAMRPDELRVGRDLVLDGARIPSEDPAHPGGDLHRDAERLIDGLVEETEPTYQDVG